MERIPESKFVDKREHIIENLVAKNVFKINGRQLYETTLYELLKTHSEKDEAG